MDKVAEAANQIIKLPAVPERHYSVNLVFSDQMLHEMKLVTNPISETDGSKLQGRSHKPID